MNIDLKSHLQLVRPCKLYKLTPDCIGPRTANSFSNLCNLPTFSFQRLVISHHCELVWPAGLALLRHAESVLLAQHKQANRLLDLGI